MRGVQWAMPDRIAIVEGDITTLELDAIVNAANRTLLGGGGQDHPGLRSLPARYVIHTVGPVWDGGAHGEERLLAQCYLNSLALALDHGLASIAYPAISTGAYGFPPDRAAEIAITTVVDALRAALAIERVVFCCFGTASREHHEAALAAVMG